MSMWDAVIVHERRFRPRTQPGSSVSTDEPEQTPSSPEQPPGEDEPSRRPRRSDAVRETPIGLVGKKRSPLLTDRMLDLLVHAKRRPSKNPLTSPDLYQFGGLKSNGISHVPEHAQRELPPWERVHTIVHDAVLDGKSAVNDDDETERGRVKQWAPSVWHIETTLALHQAVRTLAACATCCISPSASVVERETAVSGPSSHQPVKKLISLSAAFRRYIEDLDTLWRSLYQRGSTTSAFTHAYRRITVSWFLGPRIARVVQDSADLAASGEEPVRAPWLVYLCMRATGGDQEALEQTKRQLVQCCAEHWTLPLFSSPPAKHDETCRLRPYCVWATGTVVPRYIDLLTVVHQWLHPTLVDMTELQFDQHHLREWMTIIASTPCRLRCVRLTLQTKPGYRLTTDELLTLFDLCALIDDKSTSPVVRVELLHADFRVFEDREFWISKFPIVPKTHVVFSRPISVTNEFISELGRSTHACSIWDPRSFS